MRAKYHQQFKDEAVASDAVGNVGSTTIVVTYEIQTKNIIELVSGQSQSSVIVSTLGQPLKVKLISEGIPVVDKTVVYRVVQGDGLLQPDTDSEANGAIVKTDENGEASVSFKIGNRAGEGNHLVRARAVGFEGEIIFHASATYGAGNKAGVIAGNNQRGSVRQPLPQPFVLAVTDAGSNLIPNADIEFTVVVGTGKFQNGEATYITKTDKDGRASAHFTLGAEEGLDKQRVSAALVGTNARTGFTVSGFMPGDPGQTSIVGVVLDNQDKAIPAVTIRVDGTTRQAVTDDQGQFKITEVPVGPVHLLVEGSTTTRTGEWPTLSYNIVTVPGVENPMSSPIYLVELDMETATTVGAEDTILTLPEIPGFKLKVKAGSVTFPDGSKTGKLSVTPVNANKIPMPPPNGMQPQLIVTIQPHGAKFDPPAELTLPNVDGNLPGAEVEMYSYDHDLEEFVTIGLGTVSKDGSIITSNVGSGVIKAGWHCGSGPGGSGCAHLCAYCEDCTGDCDCVLNRSRKARTQTPNDCKTAYCGGDTKPANDPAKDIPKDCKEPICIGTSHATKAQDSDIPDDTTPAGDCQISGCEDGSPTPVDDNGDKPRPEDNPDNYCKTCEDGGIVADASKDNQVLPSDECKVCLNGKAENLEITDVVAKAEGQDEYVTKFVTSGTNVNFTGSATGDNCNFEYEWDFGDGGTSNQQNPTHSYTAAGEYLVEFKANCQGCPSSEKKDTVKVIVFDVELKIKDAVTTLLKENTFTAVVTSPSVSVSSYKFEIHRKTSSTWFELQNNASSTFTDKARVAGKFGVKVIVDVNGVDVESNEEDVEIQFPTYADITSDSFVISASNSAWANVKAATIPGARNEEGFWFTLNTETGKYGKTSTIIGPSVGGFDRASVNIGTRPVDSIPSPTPLDKLTYTVASFHTHSPSLFNLRNRPVGPSMQDERIDSTVDFIVGIVYDYIGDSNGNIKAGAPLNSPAQLYQSGLNRRVTP